MSVGTAHNQCHVITCGGGAEYVFIIYYAQDESFSALHTSLRQKEELSRAMQSTTEHAKELKIKSMLLS